MAIILDGNALSKKIEGKIKLEVEELKKKGITPGLAVIVVGNDPASAIYVKNKKMKCGEVGIASVEHHLPEDASPSELISIVKHLNNEATIDGILIQLPLPKKIDIRNIIENISPAKDVDGFHPENMGRLLIGDECLRPCTPMGIMALIDSVNYDLKGKSAVVVGRSNIVGKPISILLMQRDATVTICHSKTPDIKERVGAADVIIAAIGKPEFIKGEWIKKGALVIDVGINRLEDNKITGDVEFEAAKERAAYISPVPGGVGPMTIAMLLLNTLNACKKRRGIH